MSELVKLPETEPRQVQLLMLEIGTVDEDEFPIGCFVLVNQAGRDDQYIVVSRYKVNGSLRLALSPFTQGRQMTVRRSAQYGILERSHET